jgi:hypothetical protein
VSQYPNDNADQQQKPISSPPQENFKRRYWQNKEAQQRARAAKAQERNLLKQGLGWLMKLAGGFTLSDRSEREDDRFGKGSKSHWLGRRKGTKKGEPIPHCARWSKLKNRRKMARASRKRNRKAG